eukprot:TRINITY_DN4663_c0_g1_i1.p2 TRINITY_DN4663_c0_g1~~TRINITY_DN4663_c0_g1_i1.p2  ORF type:complete len:100 (+),score=15.31 TRINITY_DN4663_c0_g1_i1:207-506(+)
MNEQQEKLVGTDCAEIWGDMVMRVVVGCWHAAVMLLVPGGIQAERGQTLPEDLVLGSVSQDEKELGMTSEAIASSVEQSHKNGRLVLRMYNVSVANHGE